MDNWEDMLADDNEIEVKKEGENFDDEVVEEIKEKVVEKKKPVPQVQKLSKKPGKKRKKGKRVNLDFDEPPKELSTNEKEALETQIKKNQEKEIATMFGINLDKSLIEINLQTEEDYKEFAKIISVKLENPKKSYFLSSFLKSILSEIQINMKNDDLCEVRDKCNVLINKKIKMSSSKAKSKKKPVSIKMGGDKNFGLYDDYEMGDMGDEDCDYDGKDDDYDFM